MVLKTRVPLPAEKFKLINIGVLSIKRYFLVFLALLKRTKSTGIIDFKSGLKQNQPIFKTEINNKKQKLVTKKKIILV